MLAVCGTHSDLVSVIHEKEVCNSEVLVTIFVECLGGPQSVWGGLR